MGVRLRNGAGVRQGMDWVEGVDTVEVSGGDGGDCWRFRRGRVCERFGSGIEKKPRAGEAACEKHKKRELIIC